MYSIPGLLRQGHPESEAEQCLADAIQESKEKGQSEPEQICEPEENCEAEEKPAEIRFFEICDDFMTYSKAHKRSWDKDQRSLVKLKKFFGDVPSNA